MEVRGGCRGRKVWQRREGDAIEGRDRNGEEGERLGKVSLKFNVLKA
jgi:hypothetical protein